jgi:hypothetical protein
VDNKEARLSSFSLVDSALKGVSTESFRSRPGRTEGSAADTNVPLHFHAQPLVEPILSPHKSNQPEYKKVRRRRRIVPEHVYRKTHADLARSNASNSPQLSPRIKSLIKLLKTPSNRTQHFDHLLWKRRLNYTISADCKKVDAASNKRCFAALDYDSLHHAVASILR